MEHDRGGFELMRPAIALLCLVAGWQLDAANLRVTAMNYLTVNNGDVVYVPTWAQKDINGNFNAPSGQEILYLHLNRTTGYYELWAGSGAPGAAPSQILTTASQTCISCSAAFATAVWGNASIVRSVGRAQWFRNGQYVVFSAQDGASTLAGSGVPAGGLCTADPGVGCDHHIWVMDYTFTKFWKIDSVTCAASCGGTASGFAANGTRVVPINGKRGGWFPASSADGSTIAWSNNTCITGIDSVCTEIVMGTEIEIVGWNPGASFPSTAAVTAVSFSNPANAGGISCVAGSCTANDPQYFYEMHDFHPTNPAILYGAAANYIQTGNIYEISTATGSTRFLLPLCPAPYTDTSLCQWSEHVALAPDAQHYAAATTIDTGPVEGEPTASPVFAPATYPPLEELDFLDPHNVNGIGRVRLTYFNTPGNPEFINTACHVRFAAVVFSPDNNYILLNNEETTTGGALCPGGHGTYGYVFVLLSIADHFELRGGASLASGASAN
jgi:hypothetical protein